MDLNEKEQMVLNGVGWSERIHFMIMIHSATNVNVLHFISFSLSLRITQQLLHVRSKIYIDVRSFPTKKRENDKARKSAFHVLLR